MQFSAAAVFRWPFLVLIVAFSTACSLDGSSSNEAVLGSETVAPQDLDEPGAEPDDPNGSGRSSEGRSGGAGDEGTDGGGDIEPAPGSTDTDPVLSPDPNVVYPAGTCYRRVVAGQAAEEVPCQEPHGIEVYASVDLPGGPGAPYQGLDAAIELCDAAFRSQVGVGIGLATVYERSVLRPSEETWADGERVVTCYVVYPSRVEDRLSAIDPLRSFGRVSVFGLAAGDCIVDFDEAASWFEVVTCDRPHDAEVFVSEPQPDGPFPGEAAVDTRADELCFGESFEAFVGRDYASSSIFSLVSVPTADTWEQGDRTINCILTDDLVRSESFRDSGL